MAQTEHHWRSTALDQRPLKLLDLDFEHNEDPADDEYDPFACFLRGHPLTSDDALPALSKCNQRAARARTEGNRIFLQLDFSTVDSICECSEGIGYVLDKYNESICYSTADSEDLGIGYANRSAVYYEMGEYEHALVNIRLAKKHNYPERLMPKLEARVINCRQKLAAGQSIGIGDLCPGMDINVETNPKIPFLAKGIHMKVLPSFGRSLITNRNFKTGDVILEEKCIITDVDASRCYHQCARCTTGNEKLFAMIPCPNCVSVMYCSEECLERDWKLIHRFECAVSDKLQYISYGYVALGFKLFLYGLTLFNDDLDEMMRYFETLEKSGGNALNLDYTQYDPMEEFKDMCNVKPVASRKDDFARTAAAAHCFMLLKNPVVASIVNTAAKRTFMYQRIREFVQLTHFYRLEYSNSLLCPVASLINHSCDPNAITTIQSGHVRIIVIRPIRKGEQICVSYGPHWWDEHNELDHQPYIDRFTCKCVVCDPEKYVNWRGKGKTAPASFVQDFRKAYIIFSDDSANHTAKCNAMNQFIDRYAYLHPSKDLARKINRYEDLLRRIAIERDAAIYRAKAHADLEAADE